MSDDLALIAAHSRYLTARAAYLSALQHRNEQVARACRDGASYGEVAKVLGLPRGTVQSIVRRAGAVAEHVDHRTDPSAPLVAIYEGFA